MYIFKHTVTYLEVFFILDLLYCVPVVFSEHVNQTLNSLHNFALALDWIHPAWVCESQT